MFDSYPTYGMFRTLYHINPVQRGEDVYALQTALKAFGVTPGPLDGILGRITAGAISDAQELLRITADGRAGAITQTALVRRLADRARTKNNLPVGLVFGQLSHESSCRVGAYSPARSDGSYDAGVAQRNTRYTPAKEGFTVPDSINALGSRLREYYEKYAGLEDRRRWELAAGAWNAPAFASYIAKEEGATQVRTNETLRPSDASRATLERYIQSAVAYMKL